VGQSRGLSNLESPGYHSQTLYQTQTVVHTKSLASPLTREHQGLLVYDRTMTNTISHLQQKKEALLEKVKEVDEALSRLPRCELDTVNPFGYIVCGLEKNHKGPCG
jgi:hypothetical protein